MRQHHRHALRVRQLIGNHHQLYVFALTTRVTHGMSSIGHHSTPYKSPVLLRPPPDQKKRGVKNAISFLSHLYLIHPLPQISVMPWHCPATDPRLKTLQSNATTKFRLDLLGNKAPRLDRSVRLQHQGCDHQSKGVLNPPTVPRSL